MWSEGFAKDSSCYSLLREIPPKAEGKELLKAPLIFLPNPLFSFISFAMKRRKPSYSRSDHPAAAKKGGGGTNQPDLPTPIE